jgi:hypothetical protein
LSEAARVLRVCFATSLEEVAMQHTVIAFFDTYPQAEAARDALVAAGVAHADVTLKARCEPTYASDATSADYLAPTANEGLLASIEHFFESLFVTAPPEREAAQYAEAVRRGAVMVCVDAATDTLAQLSRSTLEAMGPLDVEERAATWQAPTDEATRSHSPLEELGLRSTAPVPPVKHGAVRSYVRGDRARPLHEAMDAPTLTERQIATEAAAKAVAAGSAPGMGAVLTPGRSEPPARPAPPAAPSNAAARPPVPDEYLQDEEHYSGDARDPGPR